VRISRKYTESKLEPGRQVSLDGPASHYLSRVLKLKNGDPLVLFNGDGSDYAAEIISLGRDSVQLAVNTRLPAAAESDLQITLVQAISRGERMDYSLQKATELGVTAIRPLFTERVEVRLDEKRLAKRMDHWRGVIRSACEQSGRAVIPGLLEPLSFDQWLQQETGAERLVLAPHADHSLAGQSFAGKALELLVGPEGGLSDTEMMVLRNAGVKAVSLGPRILRTETAGPAAIAVLQALAGDFN
jgi:16S rRNA (uracil1498-N3)-methyltransferase